LAQQVARSQLAQQVAQQVARSQLAQQVVLELELAPVLA
jgi:hypothetical protein